MKRGPYNCWGAFLQRLLLAAASGLCADLVIGAESDDPAPEPLQEITITADRLTPLSSGILTRTLIQNAPERSLDGVLRQAPGFSLFRRSDSFSAHPTSQGMSLGNTGPNGASRVALLLDGIPMNDPFGGWVPWSRLPAIYLAKVTLTPNGQPGLPAPGPLCGTVALESRFLADKPFATTEASAGNFLRSQGSIAFAQDVAGERTRLFGGFSETDFTGYKVIRRSQLGPIDKDASCLARSFDVGLRQIFSPQHDWNLTARTQGWTEERGNGTPLARNRSEALDFSLRLEKQAPPDEWSGQWSVFHQRRDFASTFTSIGAGRASESLTLDQYAVPSLATGFLQQWRLPVSETHTLALASDVMFTEGKTRERFRNLGAGFTREREAGGNQTNAGISLADTWMIQPKLFVTPSIRLGLNRDNDGHLKEWQLNSGAVTQEKQYPQKSRNPLDLKLSTRWIPEVSTEVECSLFSTHRQPTLNELYRPFRVGNTLTLANPDLLPENLRGAEAGIRWHPQKSLTLKTRLFVSELRNAIANVSEVTGPGTFSDWGVLAAGAIGARRENLEAVRIYGVEAGSEIALSEAITFEVRWLHSDAHVQRAAIQPGLKGRTPAQMPSDVAHFSLRGEHSKWHWQISARCASGQFDDDKNERHLSGYTSFSSFVSRKLSNRAEVFIGGENMGNREIQARRDPDGTIGITSPRSWIGGIRCGF